jgi:hypothetical protein
MRPYHSNEEILESREFTSEKKHFTIEFRQNSRGKFLRITEEGRGKRNSVIVPSTGFDDFRDAVDDVLADYYDNELDQEEGQER